MRLDIKDQLTAPRLQHIENCLTELAFVRKTIDEELKFEHPLDPEDISQALETIEETLTEIFQVLHRIETRNP